MNDFITLRLIKCVLFSILDLGTNVILKWLYKKAFFLVKKADDKDCICEELGATDGKAHKIKYVNILTVDGQEPNELAAVYGLGPKTARFKRRKAE